MTLPRPERGDISVRERRGSGRLSRRRTMSLLVIASSLSVAGGMWLPGVPAGTAAEASTAQAAARSTAVSRSVVELEASIAARLRTVAAFPAARDLVDGIDANAERATASQILGQLRGDEATLVRNACAMPLGSSGRTPIDGGLGDPKAAGCAGRMQREAIAAASLGDVVRDLKLRPDGPRLVLATAMHDGSGRYAGALSLDIDLEALLQRAAADAPAGVGSRLVELGDGALLATTGAAASVAEAGMLPDGPSEASSVGTAAQVLLWTLADGRQIGLVELAPGPPLEPATASFDLGFVTGGTVLVLLFLGAVGIGLRRSARRDASRARVQALYRAAYSERGEDGLTGLPDSRAFSEELEARVGRYLENGAPFALAMIDLDDLRAVNDIDGQDAGDEALIAAAETLEQLTRPQDHVFRIGGDEFAVLLPDLDAARAGTVLGRALHIYRRPPSGLRPGSFSCGVSAVPGYSTDGDILRRQAVAALAWVKGHGRGAVEVYDPDRDRVPDQPHDIANLAVREVVAGKLLSPVFQPIVDLQSGRVLGFEGLIRPDPRGPLPDTAHLFAAASASGRTVELDLACIDVVLAGAQAIGADRLLTLNLSPRTLEVSDFDPGWLLEGLLRNGIAPGRVIIELTERDAVGDLRRLQRTISQLQSYGLRLAVDDVGAGNSGLQLLSKVRFDIVKIDLSLVQQGVHDPASRAVLESLRDLAYGQHAHVVAEGVETAEQLHVIRDLEIGAGQGFLLGRPDRSVEATFVDVGRLASGLLEGEGLAAAAPIITAPSSAPNLGTAVAPTLKWGLGSSSAVARR